jgi:uncharacterized membrane protein YedE/YeeE
MTEFTPILSLLGGMLIGLAATLLMGFNGRIAGMTGILGGIVPPFSADWGWRAAFLAGAVVSPMAFVAAGGHVDISVPLTPAALVFGGLIVGVGVTLGSGCTSGHGVCGLARFSRRSLAATASFMTTAIATVFLIRHVL